jgi:hypothetical protein
MSPGVNAGIGSPQPGHVIAFGDTCCWHMLHLIITEPSIMSGRLAIMTADAKTLPVIKIPE